MYEIEIVNGQKTIQGHIDLSYQNLTELPDLSNIVVTGKFYCHNNNLTSLYGAPKSVGGNFHCHNNNLTTLQGAPQSVGGGFHCYNNKLTTLQGAPKSVEGNFYCDQFSVEDYRKYIADIEVLESVNTETKELFGEMIATL